jgi:trehalose-6-phosphatase
MNGEIGNGTLEETVDDDVESTEVSEDLVLSDDIDDIDDIDNVGDISVEINVEELVAKIEAGDGDEAAHRKEIHRRLEELEEQRRIEKELESTFNFNLDDDV